MAEYIERAALVEALRKYQYPYGVEFLVSCQPASDVAPVRHGRWIEPTRLYYGAKQYECSLCYADTFWKKHSITEKYPCCQNCGAKMDGGAD